MNIGRNERCRNILYVLTGVLLVVSVTECLPSSSSVLVVIFRDVYGIVVEFHEIVTDATVLKLVTYHIPTLAAPGAVRLSCITADWTGAH